MEIEAADSFDKFLTANPDLVENFMSVLLNYYTKERLFCLDAKERFVSPDVCCLPGRLSCMKHQSDKHKRDEESAKCILSDA